MSDFRAKFIVLDSLLPSEIARLVFGYLKEQQCDEAALTFLRTSPHLHECNTIFSSGKQFSTKVNGLTLLDILQKFCDANVIINDRLSKVPDCDQLKLCGDLVDQLKFLVDGSRGQRFVVNINVPTSQSSGGSPIISSSGRKRHHSTGDRDRSKRAHRSHLPQVPVQTSELISNELDTQAVKTTSLENLPGNSRSGEPESTRTTDLIEKNYHGEQPTPCSTTVVQTITENKFLDKCSTSTDTAELTRFTNTEVQTTPYYVPDWETEISDQPVENLSLLTKELLIRPELQERIAENINKAFPLETSLRDFSLNESFGGGGVLNTSMYIAELNNVVQSAVSETESDPVFTQLVQDVIGPSPDKDANYSPPITNGFMDLTPPQIMSTNYGTEASTPFPKVSNTETNEIPLKNRLRSSSSQQTARPEDEKVNASLSNANSEFTLEDLNAAAVLSIINVNTKLQENKQKKEKFASDQLPSNTEPEPQIVESKPDTNVPDPPAIPKINLDENPPTENVPPSVPTATPSDPKLQKKPRKPRNPKPKPNVPEVVISETEMMTMPTLIVYSKEQMASLIESQKKIAPTFDNHRFQPIAPKTADMMSEPELYLRAVNVPVPISKIEPATIDLRTTETNLNINKVSEQKLPSCLASLLEPIPEPINKTEDITLYGGESSTGVVVESAKIPHLHVEDPIINFSGTGLSPFLKFNNNRPNDTKPADTIQLSVPTISLSAPTIPLSAPTIPLSVPTIDLVAPAETSISRQENFDVTVKRTPRSLLRSRSKNHRLSLSTPRRRSSHIRALDFTTPTKGANLSRRMSIANDSMQSLPRNSRSIISNSVRRTSLFTSPPFTGSTIPKQTEKKVNSSAKDCKSSGPCKLPIATRSPAPRLTGEWDKYTGVGMIIGNTSPSSNASSASKLNSPTNPVTVAKKNWDEDLRKKLALTEETQPKVTKKSTRKSQRKPRTRKTKVDKPTVNKSSSDNEWISDPLKPDKEPGELSTSSECSMEPVNPVKTIPKQKNTKKPEKPLKAKKTPDNQCKTVAGSTKNSETVTNPKNSNTIVKLDGSVKKKYAQLTTITTNVTMVERSESGSNIMGVGMEKTEKTFEFSRSVNETSREILSFPDMMELETPRKVINGIPPTPRFLSPGSLTTPFGLHLGEDSYKFNGFIKTPDFPPTPNIVVTPQHNNDTTSDMANKNTECVTYYQPSSELKDPRGPKELYDHTRHDMSLPLPEMFASTTRVTNITMDVAQGSQASTSNNRLEITQFEVIKDNLPPDEACRELKISTATNESIEPTINEITTDPPEVNKDNVDPEDTRDTSKSTADTNISTLDDSSDSDSSSSSDSSASSSSSSSSSDSSSEEDTLPVLELTKQISKRTPSKIYTDTSNESAQKPVAAVPIVKDVSKVTDGLTTVSKNPPPQLQNESSPMKVFAILKTDDALNDCDMETPAKDETLLDEAVISETPSSSKAGIETTNLTSKITAMAEFKNNANVNATATRGALPKVVSVQRLSSNNSVTIKPLSDCGKNAMQNRNPLDEKRLRIMAKFKEAENPRPCKPRIVRTVIKSKDTLREQDEEIKESLRIVNVEEEKAPTTNVVETKECEKVNVKADVVKKITRSRRKSNSADKEKKVTEHKSNKNTAKITLSEESAKKGCEKAKKENAQIIDEDSAAITIDSKGVSKSKVDLVKRDLFTDEESNDQMTTRSRSRQTSDIQKNENAETQRLPVGNESPNDRLSMSSDEHLPGVLECLELVPAIKSGEGADEESNILNMSSRGEVCFVYDDTVPIKKRKQKFSISDLSYPISYPDPNGVVGTKFLSPTPYEEIFNISPARKRRGPSKETIAKATKVAKSKKVTAQRGIKWHLEDLQDKPLATSSPVLKISGGKVTAVIGKTVKLPIIKATETQITGTKEKSERQPLNIQKLSEQVAEKPIPKTRKRKASATKESEPLNKQPNTTNPQALLSTLDLDKFLTTVHGPA